MSETAELPASEAVPPCPDCGKPSLCGKANGCASCWCATYPRVLPVPEAQAACLCEDCLKQRLAARPTNSAPQVTLPQ